MSDDTELRQLRDRVAELEAELSRTPPPGATARVEHHRWRSLTSAVLIVVACILAPIAVTAVWANRQISDTDRYVETVAPLSHDPAVQAAVASQVTKAVLDQIDVPSLTAEVVDGLAKQNLPPRAIVGLKALEVPITNGIESFISSSVTKVVASPQFAKAWVQANRSAHTAVVKVLSGEQGGALSAQNGQITLNLAPIIAEVKQYLINAGYSAASRIPAVNTSFVLVTTDGVSKAQNAYSLLHTLGYWLPIIALILLGLGVYVARGHRRALIAGSLGFVGGMLVLGVVLAVTRVYYLNAVPSDVLPSEAAGNIFDTLVRFLRSGLRAVAVLGLVVALGAYFTGQSPTAVRTRIVLARGLGGARDSAEAHGVQTGAFGRWTFAHKRALWIALVIAGGFTLTFWTRPTAAVVIGTALVVLVLAGLVELMGRPPADPEDAAGRVVDPQARVPTPRDARHTQQLADDGEKVGPLK
ncbi:MAG: hypothetical protein QOK15_899 [Nocardioidaceae bacterium]|nr:hypothetical protein [Nocardioidaceae bacterium]